MVISGNTSQGFQATANVWQNEKGNVSVQATVKTDPKGKPNGGDVTVGVKF